MNSLHTYRCGALEVEDRNDGFVYVYYHDHKLVLPQDVADTLRDFLNEIIDGEGE